VTPVEKQRLADNQAAFREINERIREHVEGWRELDAAPQRVVCECSDTECAALLAVAPREYRMWREHPRRFMVAPRHNVSEIERVVYRHDRYWVVEKFEGTAP
jgi:hypothetical protein